MANRKRISVTASLSTCTAPTSLPIQHYFDEASRFLSTRHGLSAKGRAFTTEFAELINAEDVEATTICITAVFHCEETTGPLNGDYFDACLLSYWKLDAPVAAQQQVGATFLGFSCELTELSISEQAAVELHSRSMIHLISCPAHFLVVRQGAYGHVKKGLSLAPPTVEHVAKKPKVEGESPTNTPKSTKFIPDLDGVHHTVLDTKDGTARQQDAEFMRRLLPALASDWSTNLIHFDTRSISRKFAYGSIRCPLMKPTGPPPGVWCTFTLAQCFAMMRFGPAPFGATGNGTPRTYSV